MKDSYEEVCQELGVRWIKKFTRPKACLHFEGKEGNKRKIVMKDVIEDLKIINRQNEASRRFTQTDEKLLCLLQERRKNTFKFTKRVDEIRERRDVL